MVFVSDFSVSRNVYVFKVYSLHITKIPFHVFDRSEMHIQAFVNFINDKLIIFQASSPQNILRICTQNFTNGKQKTTTKHGT